MKTYAEKIWGDCGKAVAYQLNFVTMCMINGDYWTDSFASSTWHKAHFDKQIKPYKYPKGAIPKNRDYFRMIGYHCAVSEKLKMDMVEFGASNNDFLPILNKNDNTEIIGFSLLPKNTLPPIANLNKMKKRILCKECGLISYEHSDNLFSLEVYNGCGYPVYIDENILSKIQPINRLYESETDIIISLDLYNKLIKKYPRFECRPVFLGTIIDDPEYRRTRNPFFKRRLR